MSYRAVVFDLWDTLVVWPQGEWNGFHGRMADALGIDLERFREAWVGQYDLRSTGPLEPSVHAVCKQLGVDGDRMKGLIGVRVDWTREVLIPRPGRWTCWTSSAAGAIGSG